MLVITVLICLVFQVHSQGDNSVTVDPAIIEMETSLDMPRPQVATGSEVVTHSSGHAANVPIQNLTGGWHLELTNGKNIDLILSQSGSGLWQRQSNIRQCLSGGDSQRLHLRQLARD